MEALKLLSQGTVRHDLALSYSPLSSGRVWGSCWQPHTAVFFLHQSDANASILLPVIPGNAVTPPRLEQRMYTPLQVPLPGST